MKALSKFKTRAVMPAVTVIIWGLACLGPAFADITFTSTPTSVAMVPGTTFVTQTQVTAVNNSLGAFSIVLQYDPNSIKPTAVSAVTNSEFTANVYADTTSFGSGTTRIVGFQVTDGTAQNALPLLNITWQAVGTTIKTTTIIATVETSIDSQWQTNQATASATTGTLDQTSTDGSGMADWWEKMHFGKTGINPNADADRDGLTNLQEYLAGTNPNDPQSTLSVGTAKHDGTGTVVTFNSMLGITYMLERSTDLVHWTTAVDNIAGTGGVLQVTDPGTVGMANCFSRVSVKP